MSVVRQEFGPTLPELLGPRVRGLPRTAQIALAAVAAGVVVLAVWLLVRPDAGRQRAVVREPVAFNVAYGESLHRIAPRAGEALRLETARGTAAPQSFAASPLRLGSYRGDVTAYLMSLTPGLIEEMRRAVPGFVYRGDGRVNFNRQPGYQILYQARLGGRTTYGRRILLVPGDPDAPREGIDMTLVAARSTAVPNVDGVGANGPLKLALRSVRFGTDAP